jgi:hypothetical protein
MYYFKHIIIESAKLIHGFVQLELVLMIKIINTLVKSIEYVRD